MTTREQTSPDVEAACVKLGYKYSFDEISKHHVITRPDGPYRFYSTAGAIDYLEYCADLREAE